LHLHAHVKISKNGSPEFIEAFTNRLPQCFFRMDINMPSSEKLVHRLPPEPLSLSGQFIQLTPLDIESDLEELFALSHSDEEKLKIWRYLPIGPFADLEQYGLFLKDWISKPDVIAFTVRDAITKRAVGSISLMMIRPEHGVAELGNIWYTPSAQRTKANTEACYLLLRYCIEELNYRRMEWKCNVLNERSQRSARRLGFSFEGIFRQHMIVKGENRDTAWFSILDHEWPQICEALKGWLYDGKPISQALTKPQTPLEG
jgi:RimJ/RimL family protein N-acetyltransferase